jgi:hypothetical protein
MTIQTHPQAQFNLQSKKISNAQMSFLSFDCQNNQNNTPHIRQRGLVNR